MARPAKKLLKNHRSGAIIEKSPPTLAECHHDTQKWSIWEALDWALAQ
jgi:hypothetical protein